MDTGIDYLVTMAKASRFVRRADASDGGWENMFAHLRGLLSQTADALSDEGRHASAADADGYRRGLEAAEARYADASASLLEAVHAMHAAGFAAGSAAGIGGKAEALRGACDDVEGICGDICAFCEEESGDGGVAAATLPMAASLAAEIAAAAQGVVDSMETDLAGLGY